MNGNALTADERRRCRQGATLLGGLAQGLLLDVEGVWALTIHLSELAERLDAMHDELLAERDALDDLEAAQYFSDHPDMVEHLQAHNPDLLTEIDVPHEPPADQR